MLAIETYVKVFNLTNNPAISHVSIGEGYVINPTDVTIFSEDNADLSEVLCLVNEIFPECALVKDEPREIGSDTGRAVLWNRFFGSAKGKYDLTVCHYESIKESPAQDGATEENTQLDNSTEWTAEQILRNEG